MQRQTLERETAIAEHAGRGRAQRAAGAHRRAERAGRVAEAAKGEAAAIAAARRSRRRRDPRASGAAKRARPTATGVEALGAGAYTAMQIATTWRARHQARARHRRRRQRGRAGRRPRRPSLGEVVTSDHLSVNRRASRRRRGTLSVRSRLMCAPLHRSVTVVRSPRRARRAPGRSTWSPPRAEVEHREVVGAAVSRTRQLGRTGAGVALHRAKGLAQPGDVVDPIVGQVGRGPALAPAPGQIVSIQEDGPRDGAPTPAGSCCRWREKPSNTISSGSLNR